MCRTLYKSRPLARRVGQEDTLLVGRKIRPFRVLDLSYLSSLGLPGVTRGGERLCYQYVIVCTLLGWASQVGPSHGGLARRCDCTLSNLGWNGANMDGSG